VADVDEELERKSEAVAKKPSRDENTLGAILGDVAMADRLIA
jgi:hypothetical protein